VTAPVQLTALVTVTAAIAVSQLLWLPNHRMCLLGHCQLDHTAERGTLRLPSAFRKQQNSVAASRGQWIGGAWYVPRAAWVVVLLDPVICW
jgi:hypothetical protein